MPDPVDDPPHRPLTPRAARRAWTEPRVRVQWLTAAAIGLAVAAYAGDRLWVRHGQARLIADGVPVVAEVVNQRNNATPGQVVDPAEEATVRFPWHDQPVRVSGYLTRPTRVAARVPIHVAADDPTRWTDQAEPASIGETLLVGGLLLPVAVALLAAAWVVRRSVVRTYRDGEAVTAVVVGRRMVPTAPLSMAVQVRVGTDDRRLRTVYVPRPGRSLSAGDEVRVLLPPRRGPTVAAMWFE